MKKTDGFTIHYNYVGFLLTSTKVSLQLLVEKEGFENQIYQNMKYIVTDEQGYVLQPYSEYGGSEQMDEKELFFSHQHYEPLETLPSSLTIRPYLIEESGRKDPIEKVKWADKGVTLSQGEIGQLTIVDVTEEDEGTTFTFEVEGEDIHRQAHVLWLEDSKGYKYHKKEPAKRINGSMNTFEVTFSEVPPFDDLYVATKKIVPPTFLEELEVTIDLQK